MKDKVRRGRCGGILKISSFSLIRATGICKIGSLRDKRDHAILSLLFG
jgi:hypothetical protein